MNPITGLSFTLSLFCSLLLSRAQGQSRREPHRQNAQPDQNVSVILNTIFDGYDDRIRPGLGERPLKINMTLYILNFVEVEDKKHELTTQMYIRRYWQDVRLVHKGSAITLDGEHGSRPWSPDIFFANEVDMAYHNFAKKNSFTKISSDGVVKISDKITVTTSCPMTFAYYPYDQQICSMDLESYGYTAADIILEWAEGKETSVGVAQPPQINDFHYEGHRISSKITYLSTGNYSRVAVELAWKRNPCWHIWTIHVPLAFVSLVAILPLLSIYRSPISPIAGILTMFASIFLGVGTGRDLFNGDYIYARCYILLNWFFVAMTVLVSTTYAFVAKKKSTDQGQSQDFKLLVRDEVGAIVTLGIFIVMNAVYWLTLWAESNVDMGNDWIVTEW